MKTRFAAFVLIIAFLIAAVGCSAPAEVIDPVIAEADIKEAETASVEDESTVPPEDVNVPTDTENPPEGDLPADNTDGENEPVTDKDKPADEKQNPGGTEKPETKPAESDKPVSPVNPTESAAPDKPAESAEPVKPAEPIESVEPVKPAETGKPAESGKAAEPDKTAEPVPTPYDPFAPPPGVDTPYSSFPSLTVDTDEPYNPEDFQEAVPYTPAPAPCVSKAPEIPAAPTPPPFENETVVTSSSGFGNSILECVNAYRAAEGLAPLSYSSSMQSACDIRAVECGTSFSHTRPNGSRCYTALVEAGIGFSSSGENLFSSGYKPSAQTVVDSWMDSPGHRANILDSSFTHMCIGRAANSYQTFVVQMFIG